MNTDETFHLIGILANWWPWMEGVDPNLSDVVNLGRRIFRFGNPRPMMPTQILLPEDGLKAVEIVEKEFIKKDCIRSLSPAELVQRATNVDLALCGQHILWDDSPAGRLAAVFFIWHGCISMAKTTRTTYWAANPQPYTQDLRWVGYYIIENEWKAELSWGNPWVRCGVTIARDLAVSRKNEIHEEWIPKESPWWEAVSWVKKQQAVKA